MKRLVLVAALAVATVPLSAPAQASVCNPQFEPVCSIGEAVCHRLQTYDLLHQLLCSFG